MNSDTDFADAGRTEAFDDPWVNYGAYGYLPNDHRHQLKVRGAYALGEHWEFGATLNVQSGRPISAFGEGNPFDDDHASGASSSSTRRRASTNCDAARLRRARRRGCTTSAPT